MKVRNAAATLSFLLILVVLFSLFFVIAEADHDCACEDCPICRIIGIVEDALKKAAVLFCAAAAAVAVLFAAAGPGTSFVKTVFPSDPVSLKVKITD